MNFKLVIVLSLCFFSCVLGKGSGYTSRGISGRSRHVRGDNTDTGYRNSRIATYSYIYLLGRSHNSYVHDNEKVNLEEEFVCKNNNRIRDSRVCDWIDDCGDSSDEVVPVPCNGPSSLREKALYGFLCCFYTLWIIIVCLTKKKITSDKKYKDDIEISEKIDNMAVSPMILLFITFIFLMTSLSYSVIPAFYVTNIIFIFLLAAISCCAGHYYNLTLLTVLFLLAFITIFTGSGYFDNYPGPILQKVNITNLYSNDTWHTNHSLHNILTRDDRFWDTATDLPASFTINFTSPINLVMMNIYPTYQNQTTEQFKIKVQTNSSSIWNTIVSGPLPKISTRQSLEIVINEQGMLITSLKFIGYPVVNCSQTGEYCGVGLDEFEIYKVKK